MVAEQGKRKSKTGVVTSDKMDKTITVSVETVKRHPLYKKVVKTSKKYKVHDEANEAKIGDIVRIIETRPLSKDKRFRLKQIISRAETLN